MEGDLTGLEVVEGEVPLEHTKLSLFFYFFLLLFYYFIFYYVKLKRHASLLFHLNKTIFGNFFILKSQKYLLHC